jgi:lipoic acid synthetase
MQDAVDAFTARAVAAWGGGGWERQDVVWRHRPDDLSPFSRGEGPGEVVRPTAAPAAAQAQTDAPVRLLGRLAEAGVDGGLDIADRKPPWLRAKARMGPDYLHLKRTMRDLSLVTVCEEAGCPNIFECWADGTATFMINGERCTRACGFCLVDTRRPEPLEADEPERVAEAVARMGLEFAVVTAVARDDLADGGAGAFAETIRAIRRRNPATQVEVLIPDCKGEPESLTAIFEARPDVLNHNVETVPRLQRAVRPSAAYVRSLAVLARAKEAGLTTKSGMILGMGETEDEVVATLADLRAVGVDIVTLGQYLRPTTHHLPVARWWTPEEFTRLKVIGEGLGIGHVEASPLTRSSYHAKQAAGGLHADTAPPGFVAQASR